MKFLVSLLLLCFAANAQYTVEGIRIENGEITELDVILGRITEIDANSKLNAVIEKILMEDKSLASKRRGKVIVVDAGHGGKDPGTQGKKGTIEKVVTLQYSLMLAKTLKNAGYTVFLTRGGDSFLPLFKRRKLAQKYIGSLFISIHADSAQNIKARGLSVYTLSETATDSTAKMLASSHKDSKDINFGSSVKDWATKSALINLTQNSTITRSEHFAKLLLQNAENDRLFIIPNGHRRAGFAVLKTPNVPSVLIELGFLSNPEEEILLRSPAYKNQIVQTLFKTIDSFFEV